MARRLASLAALLLVLGGCGTSGGNSGATLRVDLVAADGAVERTVAAATEVGLVGFDAAGGVVPALASSWRIAGDGRSVIFRLRPRKWPDGKPVTAGDVVASFRRAAAPGSRARPLLAALANGAAVARGEMPASALGVGSPVDNVVEVRAAGALPGLLAVLAQPELAVTAPGSRPSALGPFRLAGTARPVAVVAPRGSAAAEPGRPAAVEAKPIVLVRNPLAEAEPPLARVELTAVGDPGAAVARFARGRTDVVVGAGVAGLNDARLLSGSNTLRVEPAWGVYGYLIHAAGPLADPRVRQALAMAVDRDDLGRRLFGVALTPVLGVVPPLPSASAPALPDWAIEAPAARLDLARQLLAAAGFGPGSPLTVTISLPDAREHAAIAAEVAAAWARIGVTTRTLVRSPADHAAAVAHGQFELAVVERIVPVDSAVAFLAPFACGSGYCNPGADALVAAARAAPDAASAATTLAAAEAAIVADTPMIALFAPVRWALVAPGVTGWTANAAGEHPLAALGVSRRR